MWILAVRKDNHSTIYRPREVKGKKKQKGELEGRCMHLPEKGK